MKNVKLSYEEIKSIANVTSNPFEFLKEIEYDKNSLMNAVDKLTMIYDLSGLYSFLKRIADDSSVALKSRRFTEVESKAYPRYIIIIMAAYTLMKANKKESIMAISEEHEKEVVSKIASDILNAKKSIDSLFVASKDSKQLEVKEMVKEVNKVVEEVKENVRVITSGEDLDKFLNSAM